VKVRNPLSFLLARSRTEEYLARYVIREYRRGRTLSSVLEDPYVRNRSTPQDRARLFERPEVIQAIGDENAAAFGRMVGSGAGRSTSRADT
jgi:hypothetical protein